MKRNILCSGCGCKHGRLFDEDLSMGFRERMVRLVAKRPEGHHFSIFDSTGKSSRHEVPLMCDLCSVAIPDGEIVYASTVWNTNREGIPGNWEKDFGTVIADDVAKTAETLSKPSCE